MIVLENLRKLSAYQNILCLPAYWEAKILSIHTQSCQAAVRLLTWTGPYLPSIADNRPDRASVCIAGRIELLAAGEATLLLSRAEPAVLRAGRMGSINPQGPP